MISTSSNNSYQSFYDSRRYASSAKADEAASGGIFESLLSQFCVCAGPSTMSQQVDEDYCYSPEMIDLSGNVDSFRQMVEHYENDRRRGGVEEFKECEQDDECRMAPASFDQDESMVYRRDFYQRHPGEKLSWFASTALMEADESLMTIGSIRRKDAFGLHDDTSSRYSKTRAPLFLLEPRPNDFDSSHFQYQARRGGNIPSKYPMTPDYRVDAIEINEDSEVQPDSLKKPTPIGYNFTDIQCYTRRRNEMEGAPSTPTGEEESSQPVPRDETSVTDPDSVPPIASADTYTTVSLCHSMDSLLDSDESAIAVDPLEEGDDEDIILVDRQTPASKVQASPCFRLACYHTPPGQTEKPLAHPSKFLLRMRPQNYIHGDNEEDDDAFYRKMKCGGGMASCLQSPASPKQCEREVVATPNGMPLPMMPELR